MKVFFTPNAEKENEALLAFLVENAELQDDEHNWDGVHYDLKRRVLAHKVPKSIKEELCQQFYDEVVSDQKLDEEVGIMQLLLIHFDEKEKEYYMMNAGYYAYGRDGWNVDAYLDFFPTHDSVSWMKEIIQEFEKIGWNIKAS